MRPQVKGLVDTSSGASRTEKGSRAISPYSDENPSRQASPFERQPSPPPSTTMAQSHTTTSVARASTPTAAPLGEKAFATGAPLVDSDNEFVRVEAGMDVVSDVVSEANGKLSEERPPRRTKRVPPKQRITKPSTCKVARGNSSTDGKDGGHVGGKTLKGAGR